MVNGPGTVSSGGNHVGATFASYNRTMSDMDAIRAAVRGPVQLSRRERRAMATRAQALSPMRILTQVLLLPVVVVGLTVSIYIRTSPYERDDALRHLAALAGCETALAMGLAPAYEGDLGYHRRNDSDGDGVACGDVAGAAVPPALAGATPPPGEPAPAARPGTGAKFLRP